MPVSKSLQENKVLSLVPKKHIFSTLLTPLKVELEVRSGPVWVGGRHP